MTRRADVAGRGHRHGDRPRPAVGSPADAAGSAPSAVPARPADAWVERARLLDRLLRDDVTPVVMVSGPAGAGKSTLVRQYLLRAGRPAAQVRVRPYLNDPGALTRVLLDALERLGPPVDDARAVVTGVEPALSGVLLPELEHVVASRPGPFVLVVDDIHLLDDPVCHGLLVAVAEAVPPGSRVVLLGRHSTPPWLARSRAERRLLEIDADALAFDPDEARALLRAQGLEGSGHDLDRIAARAEGWAVGLYLTALATRRGNLGTGSAPPLVSGAHRFVADYLRTQVLDPLDPDDREFLVRSSILDELTGPACDAVLDRSGSAAVLDRLSERLQLVVPLDEAGVTYRSHHLLADVLAADLSERGPDLVATLHRRAGDWCAATGDLDGAVRHALASGNLPYAGQAVWLGVLAGITAGQPDRLRQWLALFTESQRADEPWLSLASAMDALQSGNGQEMDRWLLRCAVHAGPDWPDRAASESYPALLATTHAVVGTGGLTGMLSLTAAALSGLPADSGFRAVAAFIRGVALTLTGETDAGERLLVEADRVATATGALLLSADALSWLGLLAIGRGDWDHGVGLIARATGVIDEHHLDRLASSAHCLTAQALLLASRGDREEAAVLLGTLRRMSLLTAHIAPWFAVIGRAVQARVAVLIGDAATARQLVVEAAAHLSPDLRGTLAEDLLSDARTAVQAMTVDGMRADALTEAELRVLQYLPTHLTLPQVGQHLFLSTNTVKSHVVSIYRKFGVSSRADAVSRARAVGLLAVPPR